MSSLNIILGSVEQPDVIIIEHCSYRISATVNLI